MTLRQRLGGDIQRVQALLDRLLDSDDALLVLIDGGRTITYGGGFGLSPCQLELLALDVERTVRSASGGRRRGLRRAA